MLHNMNVTFNNRMMTGNRRNRSDDMYMILHPMENQYNWNSELENNMRRNRYTQIPYYLSREYVSSEIEEDDMTEDDIIEDDILEIRDESESLKINIKKLMEISELCINGDNNLGNCAICQGNIDINIIIRKLNCTHSYHPNCIDQWFIDQNSCPICMKTF